MSDVFSAWDRLCGVAMSEDEIIDIMADFIKSNSTPRLIELVIKAIKKVEDEECQEKKP